MICFQDVAKQYGAVRALSGVSFEAKEGEIFGYIGPNGAGKTTSLKILTGLIRVFDGNVLVGGKNLRAERRGSQRIIGYVPQDVGFQEWRTVDHALETFAALSGVEKAERNSRIDRALELMSIAEYRKKRIVHLSGGNIQKMRIAQALLHDPSVLVLDEPLSGLDPSSRLDVKNILKDLRDKGKTILLSSHILNDIEDVADRIGILHQGNLVKTGTPAGLREEFRIGTAFELETDSGEGAAGDLQGLECLESIQITGAGTVKLNIESGTESDSGSREILQVLLASRRPVRAFTVVEPSLEDVYVTLTGGSESGG